MISTFRHKGLRRYFETDDRRGIKAEHADKIAQVLLLLDSVSEPEQMNVPGFHAHPLSGNMRGLWSVTVRANWRIVFRFADGNALDVDLVDYH